MSDPRVPMLDVEAARAAAADAHVPETMADLSVFRVMLQHPILAGVTPFTSRKLYKNPTHADNNTILLEGTIPDHKEPLAWVREHNGGRVFYTSLGVQEDFQQESFRRLLVNAIFWTTRREEGDSRR